MCHGIVPFGAVRHWADLERERLAEALARPVTARITGWDASGVGLALLCPYCGQEHRHCVVQEEWTPEEALEAPCGKGSYFVALVPSSRGR